jgi:hypothetical protein
LVPPWGFVLQIASAKLQINLKFQYPMTRISENKPMFRFLNLGHWDLFDIWVLVFGISTNKGQQSKSPQGITKAEPFI